MDIHLETVTCIRVETCTPARMFMNTHEHISTEHTWAHTYPRILGVSQPEPRPKPRDVVNVITNDEELIPVSDGLPQSNI